ncbi:hypothetical protein OKW21_000148 [Catalinimonas alkaloidigena]|uniref:hypothetical protein n=1 Tax=Catalinimonas alkaloidigena TaxID=1075417 RepID=UPI0024071C08|nr:hypothetical protein [Catalinimonas alkaloidigena]MDF9794885.1 hypothetical protein [Catalinimonas alkaloidigena]
MHPFRDNQYHFTEVAAFPYVRLPLEVSKSWTNRLQLGEGWEDWENKNVYSEYKIAIGSV